MSTQRQELHLGPGAAAGREGCSRHHHDVPFRTKVNFCNNFKGHKNVKETCRDPTFLPYKIVCGSGVCVQTFLINCYKGDSQHRLEHDSLYP